MYEMPKTTKGVFKDGESLKRGEYLMQKLGSPHLKIKSIHVAGTSGKGTTASYASAILTEQGFKVGLNISPHAKVVNERIQINNQLISDGDLLSLINQIYPVIELMSQSDIGRPSYFEAVTAIALLYFYQQKVDYAVLEVGLGGTFDTTNLIQPEGKICIINKIAKDHVNILGDNLTGIAKHKAGIIKSGNEVVALSQSSNINQIFKDKASAENANLNLIDVGNISARELSLKGTKFRFENKDYSLGMIGYHNPDNFILALKAIETLAKQDGWKFNNRAAEKAGKLELSFRFEILKSGDKTLIFDGAHNLDKLTSFVETFKFLKFKPSDVDLIFGYSRLDDIENATKLISNNFDSVIITQFQFANADIKTQALDFSTIEYAFNGQKIEIAEADSTEEAVSLVKKSRKKYVVVVGSFYLCDQVYSELINRTKKITINI